jgi:transcriptional regulator with XRE-family HTH domain
MSGVKQGEGPHKMNTLQLLIAARRDEKGWSYADLARRGGMSKATVYKLASQDLDGLPRQSTIKSLAKGLGLPERVVRDAAIQAARMGTYAEDLTPWEQVVIGHSRELSEDQRRQVMALVEAMLGDQE